MIFFLINVALFAGVVFFSIYVDTHAKDEGARVFVNFILTLSVTIFAMLLMFVSMFTDNARLVDLSGRLVLMVMATVFASFLMYCLQFPDLHKSRFSTIVRLIILVFGVVCVANFDAVMLSVNSGFKIVSTRTVFADVTWYGLFSFVLYVCVPVLSLVKLFMLKTQHIGRLFKQQTFIIAGGVLCGFAVRALLNLAATYVPLYGSLFPMAIVVCVGIMFFATTVVVVIDIETIVQSVIKFFCAYFVTSAVAGLAFALLLPLQQTKPLFFWVAFIGIAVGCVLIERLISQKLNKMQLSRASTYEDELEAKLSSFDYNEESETLLASFVEVMKKCTETVHVEIMIDDDAGFIKSVFASNERPSKPIATSENLIDSLAGLSRSIVFKSQAVARHEFSSFRESFVALFESLDAEALILLRESRHLFGLIALGPRRRGNAFTDYDYNVFSNLYSYFFLFGFYMKNIANQSLVGTVDREIQMSSQIIRSIQDNVDKIDMKGVDVGYISRSARSLGGDFIDIIRLTDTRSMMIMGDVSGKGLNASMSMVILKSIIRTLLSETGDFKELIEKVNHFIKYNLPRGTFFAGIFALFDFSENIMYYVNCGLPVLFLYTEAYNNVIEIQGDGKVLGFAKKITSLVKIKKIKLNKGDIVVACTDGLLDSESLRGEFYGKDRVQKVIIDNKTFDSNHLVQFLFDDMLQFTSKGLQDDVTAIAIRMTDS